jgi:hypothetical protein
MWLVDVAQHPFQGSFARTVNFFLSPKPLITTLFIINVSFVLERPAIAVVFSCNPNPSDLLIQNNLQTVIMGFEQGT